MRIIVTIIGIVTLIVGSLAGLGVFAYSRYVENTAVIDVLGLDFLSDTVSLEDLQGNFPENLENVEQEYLGQLPQYIEGVDTIEELQTLSQEQLQQLDVDSQGLKAFSEEYFQERFDSLQEVFQRIEEEQKSSSDDETPSSPEQAHQSDIDVEELKNSSQEYFQAGVDGVQEVFQALEEEQKKSHNAKNSSDAQTNSDQ